MFSNFAKNVFRQTSRFSFFNKTENLQKLSTRKFSLQQDSQWKSKDVERIVLRISQEFDKIRGTTPKNMTLKTDLVKDLGLDSLDQIELLVAMENEFATEVPDELITKLTTLQSVVDFFVKKLGATA